MGNTVTPGYNYGSWFPKDAFLFYVGIFLRLVKDEKSRIPSFQS